MFHFEYFIICGFTWNSNIIIWAASNRNIWIYRMPNELMNNKNNKIELNDKHLVSTNDNLCNRILMVAVRRRRLHVFIIHLHMLFWGFDKSL